MQYKIEIPDDLDGRLAEIARRYNMSKIDVIKKFIELGLTALEEDSDLSQKMKRLSR